MSVHVPHMKDVEDRLFLTLFQASNSTLAISLAIIVMGWSPRLRQTVKTLLTVR